MIRPTGIAILVCGVMAAAGVMRAAETDQPAWAYAVPTAADREYRGAPEPDDRTPLSLPGTDLMFSPAEIRGYARDARDVHMPPADWHPNDHPPMPDIVSIGVPERGVRACAFVITPTVKPIQAPQVSRVCRWIISSSNCMTFAMVFGRPRSRERTMSRL